MSLKHTLTNEKLSKRFDNPFTLVNFAIKVARAQIIRDQGQEENIVNEVLEAIASHQENEWKTKEVEEEEDFTEE